MEAIVCQATDLNNAEFTAEAPVRAESIATLSSAEMSYVGGGCLAVIFA